MKPYSEIDQSAFWKKTEVCGDCIVWIGQKSANGAGVLTLTRDRRTLNFKAHRVAHWLHYGHMPDELFCIHACGTIACVNPKHLYLSDRKKGIAAPRLLRQIDMSSRSECWEFNGYREPKSGYGIFCDDAGKTAIAHRAMFELYAGPIPKGGMILHRCDNPPCCNPSHLYFGDHAQNMIDRSERGRTASVRGNFKIDEGAALAIKKDDRSHDTVAADYGVSRTTVSFIKSGKRWVGLP